MILGKLILILGKLIVFLSDQFSLCSFFSFLILGKLMMMILKVSLLWRGF
jgi:hypothetical protein